MNRAILRDIKRHNVAADVKNYNQYVCIQGINNHDQLSPIRAHSKPLSIMVTLSDIVIINIAIG